MPKGVYKREIKIDYNERFKKVLELVEKGSTVENACKELGYDKVWFYKNLTTGQIEILSTAKAVSSRGPTKYQFESDFNDDD